MDHLREPSTELNTYHTRLNVSPNDLHLSLFSPPTYVPSIVIYMPILTWKSSHRPPFRRVVALDKRLLYSHDMGS